MPGDPDPKARGPWETPHGGADRAWWWRRRRPRPGPPTAPGYLKPRNDAPAKTLEVIAGGAPLQRRVILSFQHPMTRDWSRAPPAKSLHHFGDVLPQIPLIPPGTST